MMAHIIISNSQWTQYYGDGHSNYSMLFQQASGLYITGICVRESESIHALQVTWNNGSSSQWAGNPDSGHKGAVTDCYTTNPGQCFVSFTVRCGSWIDSLQFVTSDNQSSPIWGGGAGKAYNYTAGIGQCMSAIHISYGLFDLHVDQLNFYFLTTSESTATVMPSIKPIFSPSLTPSLYPSNKPSSQLSISPTQIPSASPSMRATGSYVMYADETICSLKTRHV